jgi:hypothetical protein
MENRKLEIISQLMEELQDLMSPGEGDFNERLGREKPDVEIKMAALGDGEDPLGGDDMGGDEYCESPEDKLKSRLLKLRG